MELIIEAKVPLPDNLDSAVKTIILKVGVRVRVRVCVRVRVRVRVRVWVGVGVWVTRDLSFVF